MDVDDFIISGDSDAAAPIRTIDLPQEDGPAGQDIVSVMPPTNDKGDDDIDNEQINRFVCFLVGFSLPESIVSFYAYTRCSRKSVQKKVCRFGWGSPNQWLIDLALFIRR